MPENNIAFIAYFFFKKPACRKIDSNLDVARSIYPSDEILEIRPSKAKLLSISPVPNSILFFNVEKLPIELFVVKCGFFLKPSVFKFTISSNQIH